MTPLALAATGLLVLSALEAVTFVAAYQVTTRGAWRRDPMGRHVMAFVAADAAVLVLGVVRVFAGSSLDTGWFAWLRVAVFVAIPWVLGWRLLILLWIVRGAPAPRPRDEAK